MFARLFLVTVALALGIGLGSLVPQVSDAARTLAASLPLPELAQLRAQEPAGEHKEHAGKDSHGGSKGKGDGHGHGAGGHGGEEHEEGPEGVIKMSPEQVAAAKIDVAPVDKGTLARRITAPGTVAPDADRIAHVAAKVVGTVAELNKRLGDTVAKGQVVAVLESREVAEAKSDHLAALVNLDLQKTLFEREQALWDKRISPEQQFLRARTTFTEAQLRVDLARQKLSALNVSDGEIAALSRQSGTGLQRYEVRSPIAGRVVERRVDLGAPVGGEGQEKELYVIADLSTVWIELAVPTADLDAIKDGQPITVATGSNGTAKVSNGKIVFISPILNPETRSARVIAAVDNQDLTWRPGSYVTAQVTVEETSVDLRVPRSALQAIGGEQVVFVRTAEGFEKRDVVLGKGDEQSVEVVFGLDPGESVAVTNSFVLKAELGKSEAEHAH